MNKAKSKSKSKVNSAVVITKTVKTIKKCTAKLIRNGLVGRPRAEINVPNKRFTFQDLKKANPGCGDLTLRKFLNVDLHLRNRNGRIVGENDKSIVVLLRDEQGEPSSTSGRGRKTHVYLKRSIQQNGIRNATNLKKHRNLSVKMTPLALPAPVSMSVIDTTLSAAENADNVINAAALVAVPV